MHATRALVRPIPEAYVEATAETMGGGPIDVVRARVQHAAYVDGLRWLGLEIVEVPVAHELPDSCFVEDRAVVAGLDSDSAGRRRPRALITRSAHPVRAREAPEVRAALVELGVQIVEMEAGVLDGGDVLQVGGRAFVGRSTRTDAAGIEVLRRFLAEGEVALEEIAVPDSVLHLKCVASAVDADTAVVAEGTVALPGVRTVEVPLEEAYAANVVGRGGRVLVADGFPHTRRRLEAAGYTVRVLDTSELQKGDGSLTCCSVWLPE